MSWSILCEASKCLYPLFFLHLYILGVGRWVPHDWDWWFRGSWWIRLVLLPQHVPFHLPCWLLWNQQHWTHAPKRYCTRVYLIFVSLPLELWTTTCTKYKKTQLKKYCLSSNVCIFVCLYVCIFLKNSSYKDIYLAGPETTGLILGRAVALPW